MVIICICIGFFAGVTAVLAKIGMQNINLTVATALRTVIVLVFSWLMVFLTGATGGIGNISGKTLVFLILSGLTTGLSWLCYYKALQDGQASVVVPIDKLSILVTIAFSGLILKEHINRRSAAGLGLLTSGTLLLVL